MSTSPEALARKFHETYERRAPEFGYKTREASAVPWVAVPDANRSLMVAVAGDVLAWMAEQGHPKPREADADEREELDYAIRVPLSEVNLEYRPFWKLVRTVRDSVFTAGFRKQHPPTVDPQTEIVRLRAAITAALSFEAILPAIATEPRRILLDALRGGDLNSVAPQ